MNNALLYIPKGTALTTIRYKIRSKNAQTIPELALWVKNKIGHHHEGIHVYLGIARNLLNGEVWEKEYCLLKNPEADGPCEFTVSEPVNENVVYFNKQQEFKALLKRGAAGDSEAAIEYCKAMLAGEVKSLDGFAG